MAFYMPGFCCGQSTIQYKFLQQDSVSPFGGKGCTFNGTVLYHLSVKGNT